LVEAAEKLVEEKTTLRKSLQRLREETLQQRARAWADETPLVGDAKVIVREVNDLAPGELRSLAIYLTKVPQRLALLGCVADNRAHLVFARSAELPMDMAALLGQALAPVEGNGGGSAQIAQGGGPRLDGLADALRIARQSISG
jgi:alanyl-tRNA synthetase